VDSSAEIGPYAIVEAHVSIGPRTRVDPFARITGWTTIGADCRIHSSAIVGDEPQDIAYMGGESYCKLGAGVVVREHVTIHRGATAGTTTIVGDDCYLMAGSHVGHNCQLSERVVLADTKLAGFVTVGPRAFLGGVTAVHQFVRIGELVMVAGGAGVTRDVPPFMLTDTRGHVVGLNVVGLRRAGLEPAERSELKRAHRLLYRSGLGFRDAVARLADQVSTAPGRRLLDFVRVESKRAFARGAASSRGKKVNAEDGEPVRE